MITEILSKLQKELKAPKGNYNSFGKYSYRSCEDIYEAVKPLLPEGVILTLSDEVVEVGGRVYVKATAMIAMVSEDVDTMLAVAFAREPESQKGMNEAQITGSASSYARKYALNGLLLIDDTKDADATNKHENKGNAKAEHQDPRDEPVSKPEQQKKGDPMPPTQKQDRAIKSLMKGKGLSEAEQKAFYKFVLSNSDNGESVKFASDFIGNFNEYMESFIQGEVYAHDVK